MSNSTIEIRNFDTSKASKSLKASFDLIIRGWGLIIHGCKLFDNDKDKWIKLPELGKKKDDGTWDHYPHISFVNIEVFKRLQVSVLDAISKLPPTQKTEQSQEIIYPQGIIKNGEVPIKNDPTDELVPF